MIKKPVLLVDLDGTIRDIWKNFCTYARIVAKDVIWPPEGPASYWFLETMRWHSQYPQLEKLWYKPGLFVNAPPYPDAVEAVHILQDTYEVFLVTEPKYGSLFAAAENTEWVLSYFGMEWTRKLVQTFDRTLLTAKYLIDDKPVIEGTQQPEWSQIIFDQPYNQGVNLLRLYTWDEVIHNGFLR